MGWALKSRSQKIQTLVELAEIEEDKAVKTLAAVQQQYQQHLAQLEQLKSYVEEYGQSTVGQGRILQPIQMLSTQAFVAKLHQAIQVESEKTGRLADVVEHARQVWLEKRTRLKALQKLHDKFKQTEQAGLDKREQRFLDELSALQQSRK